MNSEFSLVSKRIFIYWFVLVIITYKVKCESGKMVKLSINSSSSKVPSIPESRILPPPPAPNFLTSVPNALGVAGLGLLWTKEITVAIGSPILIPILVPLLFALTISLMFIPDFGSIGYQNFIEAAVSLLPKFW